MRVVLVVSKTKRGGASRITRLGDPVVVALAGETNRVPLLMGVEYAVTSSVPLGDCGCHGCSVDGTYSIEDALFALPSIWCGCVAAENEPRETNLSVSVSFDKPVVFYEDAYTNAPGDVVAKRSTRTTLSVSACGGASGGVLSVSAQNLGKLVRVGGNAVLIPYEAVVPSNATVSLSVEYEASAHSASRGDISVAATIVPLDGGNVASDSDTATAVKVALTPERNTGDIFAHRHVFGVCERVWCEAYPSGIGVVWSCGGRGELMPNGLYFQHIVSFGACNYALTVEKLGNGYSLPVRSIFPENIAVVHNDDYPVFIMTNAIERGEAGCVGFSVPLYCSPTNVSFHRIEIRELPTPAYSFTQYFATTNWDGLRDHHGAAISSDWFSPQKGNYFGNDEVYIGYCAKPWIGGGNLEWRIPNASRPMTESTFQTNVFLTTEQSFSLTEDGTARVAKFGYMVERTTNGIISIWRANAQ